MTRSNTRRTLGALLAGGALLVAAPAGFAHGDDASSSGSYGGGSGTSSSSWGSYDGGGSYGGSYGGRAPSRAVSYINPDTGAATANPDVDPNSSCFSPDRYDRQPLSDPGTANRNVHNDACFFGYRSGSRKLDAPATFESRGVGFISACPDPDGAGPKVAILSDSNGDGRNDRCFQSGYQEKGIAGDEEFHARMNNSTTVGRQSVTWCYDPDANGCSDEWVKDRITIDWVR